MSGVFEYGLWQLSALSVLGLLSVVGFVVTLGVRFRSPERLLRRGERMVAAVSAATWMAVMLAFFSVLPWWGRLAVGFLLVAYILVDDDVSDVGDGIGGLRPA